MRSCFEGFPGGFVQNNQWFLIESKHSNLVLDIEGGQHGGRIITYPKHGGDNQLWTWKGNVLVSKTGYALDVQGGSRDPGTNAIAWDYHGAINQQWRMEGDKIVSCLNGLVLDIKGGGKASSTEIILWNPARQGGVNNQSWQLVLHYN